MANMILPNLLATSVVKGVFSRVRAPGDVLSRQYGVQIGGPNVDQVSGRFFSYDVMNYQRGIAEGRAPGTAPGSVKPVALSNVPVRIPRFYEKINLDYETLLNIRQIGENAGTRDKMGLRYIERQAREEKRKHQNARELMLAAMLRGGSFDIWVNGDQWIPTFDKGSNPGYTIGFQVPTGNTLKLDMLGTGDIISASWDNVSTKIITQLLAISAAFQNLVGEPLAVVTLNDKMWSHVIGNTQVINAGGSANTPFAMYEMTNQINEEGKKVGMFEAVIRGLPWLKWRIYSGGVEIPDNTTGTPTFGKLIPDDYASFHIEHDPMWLDFVEGSEIVIEQLGGPPAERVGFTAWMEQWNQPARVELHTLQNVVPRLSVPAALAYGNIRF